MNAPPYFKNTTLHKIKTTPLAEHKRGRTVYPLRLDNAPLVHRKVNMATFVQAVLLASVPRTCCAFPDYIQSSGNAAAMLPVTVA